MFFFDNCSLKDILFDQTDKNYSLMLHKSFKSWGIVKKNWKSTESDVIAILYLKIRILQDLMAKVWIIQDLRHQIKTSIGIRK